MASMTQGTPGSSTGTVTTQTPQWMQDAIYNTITWSQNLANKPYAPYTGQRLAGFSEAERRGAQTAEQAAGAYQPYLSQAAGTLGEAGGMKALAASQPLMGQAIGASPLAAAQPYLAGAAQTFPGAVQQYMSPYTESVVQRIGDLGVRQLQEKLLPAVGEEFIRAGQFGPGPASSRMGEFGARALRDVQESVLAEQAKALQAGYGQAADIFATDVGRLGTLAGVAGQLGGAQQRALLEAAQTTGQLTTSDIENLRRISEQQAGLGESAQALGLRGATALTGIGEAERDLAQRALDLAYQQYQEETRYPYEQIGFQAGIIGGVPGTAIPRTETTTTTARGSEASTLSKILGGLAGAAGIYRTLKG